MATRAAAALLAATALGLFGALPACGGSGGNGPGWEDGGTEGGGGGACSATVLCGGGKSYETCTTGGACTIKYSSGLSIPCPAPGTNLCNLGNPDSGHPPIPDSGSSGSDTGSSGSGSDTGLDGPVGDGNDTACGAMSTANACVNCCFNDHMEGATTFINAVGNCACASPGACASQCGSDFCAGMAPGSACNACLNTALGMGGACVSPVQMACMPDADCIAYLNCVNNECSSLP
jgi:hypothetical protein